MGTDRMVTRTQQRNSAIPMRWCFIVAAMAPHGLGCDGVAPTSYSTTTLAIASSDAGSSAPRDAGGPTLNDAAIARPALGRAALPPRPNFDHQLDLRLRLVARATEVGEAIGDVHEHATSFIDWATLPELRGRVPVIVGRLTCNGSFEHMAPRGGRFASGQRITLADCSVLVTRANSDYHRVGNRISAAIVLREQHLARGGVEQDWRVLQRVHAAIDEGSSGIDAVMVVVPFVDNRWRILRMAPLTQGVLNWDIGTSRSGQEATL